MGILINQVMGDHTGKIGDLIYRLRNGKIVVYRAPVKIKKSNSKASKDIRKKLKPMSRFAAEVCSIPELKHIWSTAKQYKAKAAYHKVEQANKNNITPKRPTLNTMIVPDKGFKLNVNSAIANKNKVSIVITLGKELVDYYEGLNAFMVIILLCFYDPLKKEDEYFDFCKIRTHLTKWEIDNPAEILFKFSKKEGEIFSKYKKAILYFTLLAIDQENYYLAHSLQWSNEFVID
jgi:hypothetical protein